MTSLRHFAADLTRAAAVLTIAAVVSDYAATERRLRAALTEAQAENDVLARMVADLAGQLAVAIRGDLAALDACDTYDDFLYATGDDE